MDDAPDLSGTSLGSDKDSHTIEETFPNAHVSTNTTNEVPMHSNGDVPALTPTTQKLTASDSASEHNSVLENNIKSPLIEVGVGSQSDKFGRTIRKGSYYSEVLQGTRTQVTKPLPLVFPSSDTVQYLPPYGLSIFQAMNKINTSRPDVGRFMYIQGNKMLCKHKATQNVLKFGLENGESPLAFPLYRRLPNNTFITRWVTKPIQKGGKLQMGLAAHPRVLYMIPIQEFSTHIVWQVTTGYVRDSPITVLSEPSKLELKDGSMVNLTPQGNLFCGNCRKYGHLRRACGIAGSSISPEIVKQTPLREVLIPPNWGVITKSNELTQIPALMDIKFPNHSLPKLTMHYNNLKKALNMQTQSDYHYKYKYDYPYTSRPRKLYTVELPLERLIQFWSIFPEWIPSLSICPLQNPEKYIVSQFPISQLIHGTK